MSSWAMSHRRRRKKKALRNPRVYKQGSPDDLCQGAGEAEKFTSPHPDDPLRSLEPAPAKKTMGLRAVECLDFEEQVGILVNERREYIVRRRCAYF
ncbi:hypothetical protein TWF481_002649 [Arthrobotrys musiformis]|uniref:Uncharacterized protein n=1 Tax=Arthrobotrys musiformis TaxID=47236 RepID=A0AAV9VQU4_9PEZI